MPNPESPAIPLDAPDLSIAAYRALREGNEGSVTPAPVVETPAVSAEAVVADAVADDTDEPEILEDSKESKAPKKDKLQARFSELTAKIKALETQLTAKSGTGPTETPTKAADVPVVAPDPADPEPSADKFPDYVEWQKSWIKWNNRQDARQTKAAAAVAEKQTAAKAKADTWSARVTEAKTELTDFETVAQNPSLPITGTMAEAITDTELGAQILYHLGKNPAEAERISKLSPVAQIREIGKLENALAPAAAADGDEPPAKKSVVSKAPAPHKPLAGTPTANPMKNIEGMSMRDYRALRESGKLR